jgi:hypothetical protein
MVTEDKVINITFLSSDDCNVKWVILTPGSTMTTVSNVCNVDMHSDVCYQNMSKMRDKEYHTTVMERVTALIKNVLLCWCHQNHYSSV